MHEWGDHEYYLHEVPETIELPTFQEVADIHYGIAHSGERLVALFGIAQRITSYRHHAAAKDEDYSTFTLGDENTRAIKPLGSWSNLPDSAVEAIQKLRALKQERHWLKNLSGHVDDVLSSKLQEMESSEQVIEVQPFAGRAVLTTVRDRKGGHIATIHDGEPAQGSVVALQIGRYRGARHYDDEGNPTGYLNFYQEEKRRFGRDRFFSHFAQIVNDRTGEPLARVEFL